MNVEKKSERRWLCQRVVWPRFRTARQVSGHHKVLGLRPHCLTPQRSPGFDFRVTSGTTFFGITRKDSFLVASPDRTPDLALNTLTC